MEIKMEPTRMIPVVYESGTMIAHSSQPPAIEAQLAEIRADTRNRCHNDCMVAARIRKEIDFMFNVKKEDRLIVTAW